MSNKKSTGCFCNGANSGNNGNGNNGNNGATGPDRNDYLSFCECYDDIMKGPTGPAGPGGTNGEPGPAVSKPYDPSESCGYLQGELIYYDGYIWSVNKNCPQGVPGDNNDYSLVTYPIVKGSTGPTGIKGDIGNNVALPYDPNQSAHYEPGMIIYYDGQFYQVNTENPQGIPGKSPDYTWLPPSVLIGATGPQGPSAPAISKPYDPVFSCGYKAGQLIYYQGVLYEVNKDCPDGYPGSSYDYTVVNAGIIQGSTGPTGPSGASVIQPYDPNDAHNYYKGQVIWYDGNLYYVLVDHPQGVPGESGDYLLIANDPIVGPTGPDGITQTYPYDPDACYPVGTIVVGIDGNLYFVNNSCPQGVPGESADYTLIDGIYSNIGAQGKRGPTGPSGECCCANQAGLNLVFAAALLSEIENDLEWCQEISDDLDNLENQINDMNDQNNANQDAIDEIEDMLDDLEAKIQVIQNYNDYCSCDGMSQMTTYNKNSNGLSQTRQIGTPTQVGTFMGCPVYRQCFSGGSSQSPTVLFRPGCIGTLLDYGGSSIDQAGVFGLGGQSNLNLDGLLTPNPGGMIYVDGNGALMLQQSGNPTNYYAWVDYTLPGCP